MNAVAIIFSHTPPWVLVILALLVWIGVQGLRTRTFPILRVWITPAVFLTLSILGTLARRQPVEITCLVYLCGAALGVGPGLLTSPRHLEVDRAAGRVRFRGSPFPLIRNLVIFCAQYALAAAAMHGGRAGVAVWAIGVSGASAGYFIGWSGMFLRRILGAPAVSLAAEPA